MNLRPISVVLVALALALPAAARSEQAVRAGCEMPKPSDNAKVVMISTLHGEGLSTVTIGSQDAIVQATAVTIEQGGEPLYIVALSESPMIWRMQGDIQRVERLVLASDTGENGDPNGMPLVGAAGLAAGRVTFLKHANCTNIKAFYEASSVAALVTAAQIRRQTEKQPAIIAASRYTVAEFAVPSGSAKTLSRVPDSVARVQLAEIAADAYPAGLFQFDPAAVTASKPAETYTVLPGEHGLLQLVKSGALQQIKNDSFVIRKPIRMPAGLETEVTLLLPRGLPRPEGNPGYACIHVEGTNEVIGDDTCQRRPR